MRRLLIADVNGTILPTNAKEASPRAAMAVEQMQKEQRSLAIATSLSARYMTGLATSLKLKGMGILDGGATIHNFETNERDRELSRWLNKDTTREVVAGIGQRCLEVYYDEHSQKRTPNTIDLSEIQDEAPSIFAVYHEDREAEIKAVLGNIDGISARANVYDEAPNQRCIQVTQYGVSKQSGTEILLASDFYRHLPGEEVAAIGDGEPDKDLFDALPPDGLRIAMGNADVLKQYADVIVPSVDDDGFAFAVEKYILE